MCGFGIEAALDDKLPAGGGSVYGKDGFEVEGCRGVVGCSYRRSRSPGGKCSSSLCITACAQVTHAVEQHQTDLKKMS